jgi:hypothetical protein
MSPSLGGEKARKAQDAPTTSLNFNWNDRDATLVDDGGGSGQDAEDKQHAFLP